MSSIVNRSLTTRAPIAAENPTEMAKGRKGNFRFPASQTQTTQRIPDHLRGHFVSCQAIGTRVQYEVVLKGDTVPTLVIDAVSTFEVPDEGCAPTLLNHQCAREFWPKDADQLTFICAAPPDPVDPNDPEDPVLEVWLTDAQEAGVNSRPSA